MFTGIIEDCASISHIERNSTGRSLCVKASRPEFWDGVKTGDSISVSGVCLTVKQNPTGCDAVFDILEETFSVTALGTLKQGQSVNLEKALRQGDRLGGHMVSGHVDCTGTVTQKGTRGADTVFRISFPPEFRKNLIDKGSIAVAGISLTVMELGPDWFSINIIPHTLKSTSLRELLPGAPVNLEFDLIGKYVLNACSDAGEGPKKPGLDIDFLRENGFA